MKKISWQSLLSVFLFVIGTIQLIAFLLMLMRFKIVRPQNLILSIVFIGLGFILYKVLQDSKH